MKSPPTRPSTHAAHGLAPVAWVLGILACLVWSGCSIEKNYSTLSFFFDGVPNPADRAKEGPGFDIHLSPTYSVHKPYTDENCDSCHSQGIRPSMQNPALCVACHAQTPAEYANMHGPVAAGACLWCHAPHESAEAHLLRKPARQLCTQCHDTDSLTTDREPAHADAARDCLDCHGAHGGDARYFLHAAGAHKIAPAPPSEESRADTPAPSDEPEPPRPFVGPPSEGGPP